MGVLLAIYICIHRNNIHIYICSYKKEELYDHPCFFAVSDFPLNTPSLLQDQCLLKRQNVLPQVFSSMKMVVSLSPVAPAIFCKVYPQIHSIGGSF